MKTIELTKEQRAEIMKHVTKIYHGVKDIAEFSEKGRLDNEFKENVMSVCEFEFDKICQIVGYDGDTKEKVEKRHAKLRQANQRIRELENLIGQDDNCRDKIQHILTNVEKKVSDWWEKDGLGYLSTMDSSFHTWCYFASLSCRSLDYGLDDDADIEEIYKDYHLVKDNGHLREYLIAADDHNQAKVVAQIHSRFPSAKITEMKIRWGKKVPYIDKIEVRIPLGEI